MFHVPPRVAWIAGRIPRKLTVAMGLTRPADYVPPPPPSARDVARTMRVACTDVAAHLARLALHRVVPAPSTATPDGLRRVRASFGRTLRRIGVTLEVLGAERVPDAGGLVLMWNQESHLDHLVLATAIPRPFFSLYNSAVARVPFYGTHMRTTGHVHVDRDDEAQWRASVALAAARVAAGECVLVSPEGTRSWDGRLLPMKRGAFILASSSESPIVCVTVIGGHARMPRGSAFVKAGPMRVVFAEPIAVDRDQERLAAKVVDTFERVKRAFAV